MTSPQESAQSLPPGWSSTRAFTIVALGVALLIACVLSLFASSHPDGLEFVADSGGFLTAARDSVTAGSPLADYAVTGIPTSWLSTAIAGAVGCAVTFGLALVLRALAHRRASE